MLAYGLVSALYKSLINREEEVEPDSVIDNEEELDRIIEAIAEEPPPLEVDRLKKSVIVSEEGVCLTREGTVTGLSTNTGMIDEFIFDLDDTLASQLQIGSKVTYKVYRHAANEEWRVKSISVIHEENWEGEATPVGEENGNDPNEPNADESVPLGETVGESGIFEKILVCKVERREGRIAITDTNIRCDLNTITANFTPLAGDYVAVVAYVQVEDNSFDLSGEILEVVGLRPTRHRKLDCLVTSYDAELRVGKVDNNIFFRREVCTPGYIPTKGDKVVVEAIESDCGPMCWRAISVEPRCQFERPSVPEEERVHDQLDDQSVFKDKNCVYLTKCLDFGTLEINQRRVLEFTIENGGAYPVRVESIELVRAQSGQLMFCDMPVVPRSLAAGAIMRMSIACTGKVAGFHQEMVLVEFAGFKTARRIFCEVTSAEIQRMKQAPVKRERYNYKANREEAMRRQRAHIESDVRAIPGVPLNKSPAFVAFRMPPYAVPKTIYDLLNCPRCDVLERIFAQFPFFRRDLEPTTYARRFSHLLYIAEAEAVLELRRYDIMRVKFEQRGEYLSLSVPGLAESRPSLLVGDRVEAISPYVEGEPFLGVIHKLMKTEVYIKFDPAFHQRYKGEDYKVLFHQSRGAWRKCHHAIQRVCQTLGTTWLFPSGVVEKPPQIEFQEVNEPAPEPEPTPTPAPPCDVEEKQKESSRISYEERRKLADKNYSSSSDEGYIRKIRTPKRNPPPLSKLLSMVKEEKDAKAPKESSDSEVAEAPKESSDSEVSSLSVSRSNSTVSERAPSIDVERLRTSLRLNSDSEVSDGEKSGSETKTVRRSPRDGLRMFLQQNSSGENSPVRNGSQTPTSSPARSVAQTPNPLANPSAVAQNASNSTANPSAVAQNASNSPTNPSAVAQNASNSPVNPSAVAQNASNSTNPSAVASNSAANPTATVSNDPANPSAVATNKSSDPTAVAEDSLTSKLKQLRWINRGLNPRQKEAVRNVLRGEARPLPYIIFGPPGTGKTITLVEAILQIYLLMPESRLLIATPSNSSSNLIAERLLDAKILKPGELVRLVGYHVVETGNIPDKLIPYCALLDINAQAPENPEMLNKIPAMSKQAVGRHRLTVATCVSSGQLFSLDLPPDHFTHIVIDEAGQAQEPEAMNPLAFLSRRKGQAILAGDPLQLGPVVPSKLASELGLGTSFLSRLLKRFPYNRDLEGFPETGGYDPRLVTRLVYNYRSVPSILQICSEMFYDSELVPTLDGETSHEAQVQQLITRTLRIPKFGVVFEGVRGDDNQAADDPSWFNLHEVISVLKYVAELIKLGVPAEEIGIITPYRKQVQRLRSAFEENSVITTIPKIGTVEEFQGQERLIIIVSTVRSSNKIIRADQKHHLGFVSSPQRLNVAISRAKALLIIVGNPHLLCYDAYWRTLFKYCYKNKSYIGCSPPPFVFDNVRM